MKSKPNHQDKHNRYTGTAYGIINLIAMGIGARAVAVATELLTPDSYERLDRILPVLTAGTGAIAGLALAVTVEDVFTDTNRHLQNLDDQIQN